MHTRVTLELGRSIFARLLFLTILTTKKGSLLCHTISTGFRCSNDFCFYLVTKKGLFLDLKQKKIETQYGLPQFKIPAADAVCVKAASSLTFCAHGSLQRNKRVKKQTRQEEPLSVLGIHFWTSFEIHLLCTRVQNWALDLLNLMPLWGAV